MTDYSSLKQFDVVNFTCTDNKTLAGVPTTAGMSPGYLEQGVFKLPCQLDDEGKWVVPTEWPTCSEKTAACTTAISDDPSIDASLKNALEANFVTSDKIPGS